MASLTGVGRRFQIPLVVIAGGSGVVRGVVSEADQRQVPVNSHAKPRHILRTPPITAVRSRMVLRAPSGAVYIVGENGPSDTHEGTLWRSYRLFEATGFYRWQRRTKVEDPVTKLPRDDGLQDLGEIWCVLEPMDREVGDFRMSASFEQSRLITGSLVKHDDLIDGRKVTRSDAALGVQIGTVTA